MAGTILFDGNQWIWHKGDWYAEGSSISIKKGDGFTAYSDIKCTYDLAALSVTVRVMVGTHELGRKYTSIDCKGAVTAVNFTCKADYFGSAIMELWMGTPESGTVIASTLHSWTLKEVAPTCDTYTTKSSCEAAGCYWYNNACHEYRPVKCSDYTDALTCAANNCYWWLDGTCHDTEEEVPTPGVYKEECGDYPTESATKNKLTTWWACATRYAFNTRRICKNSDDEYADYFRAVRDDVKASEGFLPYCPYYGCKHKEWAPNGHGVELYFKSSTLGKWSIGTFSYLCSDLPAIEKKDTVICDFDVYDAADKKATDLVAGVRYAVKAYLCKVEGGGCAEILKGCDSGCEVEGGELKLAVTLPTHLTKDAATGTTNIDGYTGMFWTPDIGGTHKLQLEFKGSAKYNASESSWKTVTVSAGKFIINVPKGIFGPIGKGVVMVYKVSKLPFIDAYVGLGIPAKDFWCETPPCTFEVVGLEKGGKYAIFPSSSISVLPYVTSKCVYEFTDKVQTIDLPVYIDPLSTVLCDFFDLTPSECAVFLMEFQDPIYAANTLSVIRYHEDMVGNPREPETLDYVILPIVMVGSLLPGLPMGQISKWVGRMLKLAKKSVASKTFLIRHHQKLHHLTAVGDEARLLKFKAFFDADKLDDALKILNEGVTSSEATEAAKALKRASLRKWCGGIIAKWKKDNPKTTIQKLMDDTAEHGGNVFKTQADVIVKHVDDAGGDWTKIRKIWDDTVKTADDVVYVDLHLAGQSDNVQVIHNMMRYTKDDFVKALKAEDAIKPKKFANRFDEGVEFMLRHIGDETGMEVAKYRKAIKGLSDADINNIVKNLDAAGQVNLARTIKTLKVAPERGMKYFDDVEAALRGTKKLTKEGRKAMGAVLDSGIDDAMKHLDAKWEKIGKVVLETDDPLKNPNFQRFWKHVKGSPKAKAAMAEYGTSRFRDLPLWLKLSVLMGAFFTVNAAWKWLQDFCFALFMGEETIQWGGFGGISLMRLLDGFEQQPLVRRKEIIATFEEFYNKRAAIHAFVTGTPMPSLGDGELKDLPDLGVGPLTGVFEHLCIVFGPYFRGFWEADAINMWALAKLIDHLNRGINPFTGIGECSIKVRANKDGVHFWYQGSQTKWYGGRAFSEVEILSVPVRDDPYICSIMAWLPGYKVAEKRITIYREDVGATGAKAKKLELFDMIPESTLTDTGATNPFPQQTAPDTTSLPTPYGDADPIGYISGVTHGSIRCESIPTGAEVFLQLKGTTKWIDKGKTDITLDHIPVGVHKILIRFPGFDDCVDFPSVTIATPALVRCRFPTPTCSFTPSTTKPKLNEVVTFDASASTPGTGAASLTYDWDWGDLKTHGTKKIDTHTYTAKGVYAVKLTVTNEMGGSKVHTTNITVEVATGDIKCYCEPAEYCGRNADIFVDGKKVDVTKASGYSYIKDLTPGVHTVKYNLLDVMECVDDVVVTADKDAIYEGVLALSEKIKSACSYDPTNFYYKTVKVTKIEDGDSIFTDFTNPFPKPPLFPKGQQVRIAGYDSPDGATARANAKKKLTELIPAGETVTLKIWPPTPLGKLNRVLAGVFKGDVDIAIEMLKSCLVNESAYKGKDNFPWVGWVDYGRLWEDPVGEECLINPDLKPLVMDIDTTRKTFKINNRWFTLDFTVRYEDEYGVQKGVETKKQVDGRKVSTPIAYAMGTYAIKLFACIEKCDKKENWILVDTGYVVVPTKKTVTFKSVPAGASVTVVKKETARLVRVLKKVIRI